MTMGRGEGHELAAGGPARHIPVLLEAVLAALRPVAGETILDGTFGAGGYSKALLQTPGVRVIALDRDPNAIADGAALVASSGGRLQLRHARFGALDIEAIQAGAPLVDGVVLDIGVSSMQIDDPARGFSFLHDGPLDMRMEASGPSAADLVNTMEADELADLIYGFGEERASRRIAAAIVMDRKAQPFTTTRQLAELIARIVPHKAGDIHPATRTFQALRIAVNDELGELQRALVAAEKILRPGGRLVVVSFHSLEDRIVKQFLAGRSGRGRAASRLLPGEPVPPAPTFLVEGRQPVIASEAEAKENRRARSARLRHGVRTSAPAPITDETRSGGRGRA